MHSLPIESEKISLLVFSIWDIGYGPWFGSTVESVFSLYGRSTLLVTGLSTLHCIQIVGSFILGHRISGSLSFNPICNGGDVPRIIFSVLVSVICIQAITWALILRKVRRVRPRLFPSWRRYLRTSEAQGCQYILRFERDWDTRTRLAEAVDSAEGKGEQFVGEDQSHGDTLPTQTGHRYFCPPPRQAEIPLPRSSPEASPMRTSELLARGHNIDMMASNYPYLHGAESYILNRNRGLATTFTNSSIDMNHSPRRSSDCGSRRTASATLSHTQGSEGEAGLGSVLRAGAPGSADEGNQNDKVEETQSKSNIEIGSLQSSSSVNSEELRRFYNGT
ncbi:hypothetical protein D9619_010712 [Psilocybe cf. subviscida]|uniref:Uncharacterized protein n=1 Tax=Psilocybe cf. subviscida TaxID=2480587 RepID=A0A8H5F013_9AGAR|nr:hypothetical protein D9619_010712 [Psilocybe cf. subviscida]